MANSYFHSLNPRLSTEGVAKRTEDILFDVYSGEILLLVILITGVRVAAISKRPLPHDVQSAIMNGTKRIVSVFKREAKVEGNAPYGIIWYGINVPIARLVNYDGRKWMIVLALLDSIFLWFSQALGVVGFVAYLVIGTFQLLRAPWNASINWIIVLGIFNWWFLLLAPIAKLPFGLPFHAFGDTGRGLFYQHNYIYYGLLGTLWLVVFLNDFALMLRDISTGLLGLAWILLLGFLYVSRTRKMPT